ncbi:hypothetical protein NUACC21_48900 [Scytonema sp. NUACC21]
MSLNVFLKQCPFSRNDYNPFTSPQIDDPYPFYARARQETPVFYSPLLNAWIVTRYDDICTVMKDPIRFSSKNSVQIPSDLPPEVQEIMRGFNLDLPLVNHDPPIHTRLRSIVGKVFLQQSIAAMKPRIQAIAHELVDSFVDDGRADLIAQFAYPLPMIVMTALLGVPRTDIQLFKQWSDDWAMLMWENQPLEQQVKCAHGCIAFQNYTSAMLEERRRTPQDDITTKLLNALQEDEYLLSTSEIATLLMGFLFSGHESTTKLIANALLVLLRHPNQWRLLQENLHLAVNVVEETLRIDSPAQGMFRTTTEAVELGGVTLPAGARLQLMFASANRDETHFPNPDCFNIHRPNLQKHLGFGWGIHLCLGAPLVRLESQVALEVLAQRLPSLRFQQDFVVQYEPNVVLRGPKHLLLEWDAVEPLS